jgi:NADPH-dependent curcumin reductase CurA
MVLAMRVVSVDDELPDGALLVHNHYCSLDPAMRGWLKDAPSYMPPIPLNDAIRPVSIGRVAASRKSGTADSGRHLNL